jgi:hypothetical protein
MKLHQEFKLYENMWEDEPAVVYNVENPEWTEQKNSLRKLAKPVYKTFGSHKYDITKLDELEAWVEKNAEFQFKRHPNSYKHYVPTSEKDEFTQEERHAKYIYITILNNLEKSLDFGSMDGGARFCIKENIHTLKSHYERDYFDRHYTATKRKEASESHDKDFDDFIDKVFPGASNRERENIKSKLKDIYVEYMKSIPNGVY